MASETAAIDDQLILLKIRFAERTAAQLDALWCNLATWQNGHYAHEDTESLYLLLHQLAESSGNFGFNQLGQQAARAEKIKHNC
ncbi:Hpt domain-containing protein [Oceanisphaera ostreae]|uniref:Hpt domain-containing protein n=1 Tax=Oceanisphaera ostreae TaxID=914151 RepID=A0ABW3KJR4_9GAMM